LKIGSRSRSVAWREQQNVRTDSQPNKTMLTRLILATLAITETGQQRLVPDPVLLLSMLGEQGAEASFAYRVTLVSLDLLCLRAN
jgi:hypothetical protein